jgi:hypothetical protein
MRPEEVKWPEWHDLSRRWRERSTILRPCFVICSDSISSRKLAQMSLNDGRSDGLGDQHALILSRKKSGREGGIDGRVPLFTTHR